jgi:outer membrane receptor protein involved in Fe transport
MKSVFCGASSVALLAGLLGSFPAWAQTPTSQPAIDQTPAIQQQPASPDRVVITGSFIQGTPEDTALPVEVFSQEELEDQGSPTALEFAKTLTIAGPTTGESYYFGGVAPGTVTYNLRGIGADKTLTLLNGRRVSENASNIPSAALARTPRAAWSTSSRGTISSASRRRRNTNTSTARMAIIA